MCQERTSAAVLGHGTVGENTVNEVEERFLKSIDTMRDMFADVKTGTVDGSVRVCPVCNSDMSGLHYRKKYCSLACTKRGQKRAAGVAWKAGARARYDVRQKELQASRKRARANYTQQFVGVDGEGINMPDGTHRYIMLSVGDETLHKNGVELTHEDILPFLYGHMMDNPDEKCAYIGFYLGYDFTQWFKHLSEHQARLLFTRDGIAARQPKSDRVRPFPVYIGSKWEIDILGMKRLRFRPHNHHGKHGRCGCGYESAILPEGNDAKWFYLCDVGSFFQSSFIKVLNPKGWPDEVPCTEEEYQTIIEGKNRRADTATLDDLSWIEPMIEYNRLENRLLANVMRIYSSGFADLGIRLDKTCYYGPGQSAQKWLNKQAGFLKRDDIVKVISGEILDIWRQTYYGGRFEIFYHGTFRGEQYEYDIQSAYPDAIRRLPCLCKVQWVGSDEPRNHPFTLVYATIFANQRHVSGLPYRDPNGSILYPLATRGWYRWQEVKAAMPFIDQSKLRISRVLNPVGECKHDPPLKALGDLFALRQQVGKNTPQGKALKLIYNSCYGKMAQSIGSPKYANPIYASMITSDCRIRLLDAISTHPNGLEDVIMCATDGIYFKTPHPDMPKIGENIEGLGLWETTVKSRMTLMKPGVYWDDIARRAVDAGKDASLKSRGISAKALQDHLAEMERGFESWSISDNPPPALELRTPFSIVSPRLALARGKWDTAGLVEYDKLRHDIADCYPKRRRWWTEYKGLIKSSTRAVKNIDTTPYEKTFGMEDAMIFSELYTRDGEKALEDWINAYIELREE